MKQIKLDYVTNEKFNKEITISGNFITRAYQIFNGKTKEKVEKIEDIIKVVLLQIIKKEKVSMDICVKLR